RNFMRRQEDSAGDCNADFCCRCVIERLLVSTPPERVVYHRSAGKSRVLEKTAIKGRSLRNSIDNDIVAARLALDYFGDFDGLGYDFPAARFLIHAIDERPRKRAFLTE